MRWPILMTSLVATLIALQASASKPAATCQLLDKEGAVIEGENTDKMYPIASVSKLFTSYWAVSQLGAYYRYQTLFHVLPLDGGLVDMHIQGSRTPYFGREQLQYIVAQLNSLGVKKIRNLTFDEKFAYINLPRGDAFAAGHYAPDFPTVSRVQLELEDFFDNVAAKYSTTKIRGRDREIEMPEKISMAVEKVSFQSAEDFQSNFSFAAPGVRHLVSKSVPMHRLLKEMNRNSNNYAANLMFEDLGGAAKFNAFITKQLGVTSSQVEFFNGSGDSHDFDGGEKLYNQATCEVVLAAISSLKKTLEMQELRLTNVVAVAGADSPDESSTVSDIYENDVTSKALMAKTGTVDPAVTLAGVASTEQGNVYFGYIYSTNGTRSDWRSGRNKMKTVLLQMFETYGGAKPMDYQYKRFLSFDDKSALFEKTDYRAVVPTDSDLKQIFSELFRPTSQLPNPANRDRLLPLKKEYQYPILKKYPPVQQDPYGGKPLNLGGNK
jgi:serine-type D-Ala-D-Ala carboxypeptidase/endopeptidase (penicillin-binding protein 4)